MLGIVELYFAAKEGRPMVYFLGPFQSESRAIPLTYDHKASNERERARVLNIGGEFQDYGPYTRLEGILIPTRG